MQNTEISDISRNFKIVWGRIDYKDYQMNMAPRKKTNNKGGISFGKGYCFLTKNHSLFNTSHGNIS